MSRSGRASNPSPPARHYVWRAPSRPDQSSAPAPGLHPILEAAAGRVAADRREIGADVLGGDLTEVLGLLATAVQRHLGGDPAPIEERVRSGLGRRMLELLRAEVVRAWPETDPSRSAMPGILAALERVRETIEPAWADFAACLSGRDGVDVAVDIAHDLRSPLTSIRFLAETLQGGQSGPVNELQRRQLGLICCAALGLTAVTNDIIDVARGSGHLVENEPVPFSLTAVLDSVYDMVRPIAEEKRLTVRLAPPTQDQRLGHPIALGRVLLNLTTNALKFTDEGSVEIVTQERGAVQVEFSVRDRGKGIEPAVVDMLYQPLRRVVGRAGARFSPAGLGLTMCRSLIAAMGAELHVETRQGWGTRFFFELGLPAYTPGSGACPGATTA